ncbi:hypothetical protein LOAG_13337 [Loa loa]|nr:hypothetical protein LOAG_13337 [Loa loa]EFO15174.1 hypothetical protein LOAG_13337 [Loa loa]
MQPMSSGIMRPLSSGIMQPVSSGIMRPVPSGIVQPMSSGIMRPVSSGIVQPMSPGIMRPVSSGIVQPMSSGIIRPLSLGTMHPASSGIMHPVSSVPLALLFPNGSVSAPTTPVATESMRNINRQMSKRHQPGKHNGLSCAQSGNLKNSEHWLKFEPVASSPATDTSVARNSKHVTPSIPTQVYVPASMAATPCFSSSAPAASNMIRSQIPSKDISSVKSTSQKRPFSLDMTPKRKTDRRLAQQFRRQQQQDNVNFAGAKFSESPQAKVVPLPPFIWCEEEVSSSSSCSGDEQSIPSITEVEMAQHGKFYETSKRNKWSRSLQMTPLHCIAVLPNS